MPRRCAIGWSRSSDRVCSNKRGRPVWGSRLASSLRSPTHSAPSPTAPLSDEHVLLGMLRAPEPRRARFSPARERNFWLVQPFSINGATDGPGADDSGGAGHKGWPPAAPSAGGPVRAAGASSARVIHDSDRLRRPEDAVGRFWVRRVVLAQRDGDRSGGSDLTSSHLSIPVTSNRRCTQGGPCTITRR